MPVVPENPGGPPSIPAADAPIVHLVNWFRNGAKSTRADSAGRWALAVFVVVAIASALVAVGYVVSSRNRDRTLLATQAQTVSVTVDAMVRDAGDQVQAIAALYAASDEVTEIEFTNFVMDIGLTEGMFGVGFVTVIDADQLPAFEASLRRHHPEAFVFEVDGVEQVPVAEREIYYPIELFHSVEYLPAWGFDAATDDEFGAAIERILEYPAPTASGLVAFPGRPGVDGWVMFHPAFDSSGRFSGVVAAAMDIGDVLAAAAPVGVGSSVDLRIVDLSTGEVPDPPDNSWTATIAASDRLWRLDVTPRRTPSYLWAGLGLLLLGLAAAVAFTLVVLAFGARLRQRREMEELRSLDRQKDDFLATVSHELRTPLTSILGFADAMSSVEFSDGERSEMMGYIGDEAKAMEGIVQDLLVVARLQQGGTVPISREPVADLAAEVAGIAAQMSAVREVPFTITGNGSALADPARVRQILRNLFDNAVRYGRPPIAVSIDADGGRVRVMVRDDGDGIAPSIVPTLFDRYRSGPNPDGLPTSTGIGLWLSRELARLMGGDLRVLPGDGGAAFELTIPAAPARETAGEVLEAAAS